MYNIAAFLSVILLYEPILPSCHCYHMAIQPNEKRLTVLLCWALMTIHVSGWDCICTQKGDFCFVFRDGTIGTHLAVIPPLFLTPPQTHACARNLYAVMRRGLAVTMMTSNKNKKIKLFLRLCVMFISYNYGTVAIPLSISRTLLFFFSGFIFLPPVSIELCSPALEIRVNKKKPYGKI